jgi:branched-chain amino acid transport system ATP-binding protein
MLEGRDISRLPPHRITQLGIARTYQNIRLFGEMSALENLLIAQHGRGRSTIIETMLFFPSVQREEKNMRETALTLLSDFNLGDQAHSRAGALPYGDQRRLEMARALATAPKLMLLDEPTAGMNPVETHELGEQILKLGARGVTVLVIEHDMSLIQQVCDEIYVLNFGQIIAHGTHDEIKNNPQVVEAYLGEDENNATV